MEPRNDPRHDPWRLDSAIRAVGRWRGRDIDVAPVSVGRDERHFLIEVDDDLFVLRLANRSTAPDGPGLAAEFEIARAAAAAGVAPEVVEHIPQLGCLVTRFVRGRKLTPPDAGGGQALASVVGSLRALHACPVPGNERSVFREAREFRRAALAHDVPMPGSEPMAPRRSSGSNGRSRLDTGRWSRATGISPRPAWSSRATTPGSSTTDGRAPAMRTRTWEVWPRT